MELLSLRLAVNGRETSYAHSPIMRYDTPSVKPDTRGRRHKVVTSETGFIPGLNKVA